ncbi:MAG: Gfo/Idh/MocA family oxidoreductase [Oscillospiraceae bacterium]|nr:Gfo/Idh/MocA family oxidoreductase [Oscillospiraceae bacterium]MBQ7130676.1 Gfo/Idh/MocA family oxidoreductase [Oscillospiraceae bacterium]
MKEIRLGTIGTGVIVEQFLDQVVRTEGICLRAVYSRKYDKGSALAEKYGAGQVYTDLDSFFYAEEMDCVYIASPNILHYPQTKQALLSGKHVLCEKPFCTTVKQAEELFALAEERGLLLMEAVPTAFLPNLNVIREQLPKIGKLRLVQGNYSQYSSRYDALRQEQALPNVFNPAFAGGCLMDLNYYNVYLNVALFGSPDRVQYWPNLHSGGVDTSGILILQYPGFVSQASGAKDTWYDSVFTIQGEDGFIQIPGGSNGLRQVRVVTKTTDETFDLQSDPARLSYEVRRMTDILLREDREAISRLRSTTLAVIAVLEAGRKSGGIRFPGEEW